MDMVRAAVLSGAGGGGGGRRAQFGGATHTHHARVHPNPDQVRDLDNITHPNPTPTPNPDQVRELDDITNLPLTLTLTLTYP